MPRSSSSTPPQRPRKLFVALGGLDYEGYSEPIGVFSTKKKAEKAVREATGYDHTKVIDYRLDKSYDIR